MFAAFASDAYEKSATHNRLLAEGKTEAAAKYTQACEVEGASYGKAGLKLMTCDIPGAIIEAKKGIDARVEQNRIARGES